YFEKPMASGVGIGWLYLAEAEHYKPNLEAVKETMARYAPMYQLRSRLSIGVVLRDQTSRRDSQGFADQLRDAIVSGLESSGIPVKALRQFNESDAVQPNFLVVAEILEHRVVKNNSLETLQSKYRAGTHEVKNEAWLQANRDYEATQQQLRVTQRDVVVLLPAKVLSEARARAQRGDLNGAAEEYVVYLNAVSTASSQEHDEAARFLHEHFNVTAAAGAGISTESRLRPIH